MKDLFGNKKPIQIGTDEWWFNGRIIQKSNDCRLPPYCSFPDADSQQAVAHWAGKREATKYCLDNPHKTPKHQAQEYI